MDAVPDFVGKVLGGRYRVLRPIGRGGMGAVYEAEQLDLARRVAVKVLFGADPRSVARLRQEATTAGALRSPHVVAVIDFQTPPGEPPFLVMELLEGEPLSSVLVREGRLEPSRAVRIATQMLAALDVAHRAGLVHRDVKPSNVWLTRTLAGEVAKLLDFGIVKDSQAEVVHTTLGAIVGTPAYLAPEQVRGWAPDPRVDIHAVGVVLFEMLTGTRPWNPKNLFAEILERVPPPVSATAPDVPLAVSEVVARALAKDPDARFRSAADMLASLAPFATGPGSGPRSPNVGPIAVAPTVPRIDVGAPVTTSPTSTSGTGNVALFLVVALAVVVLGGLGVAAWIVASRSATAAPVPAATEASPAIAIPPASVASTPPASASAPLAKPSSARPAPKPATPAPPASAAAKCMCLADVSGYGRGPVMSVCTRPAVPSCGCSVKTKLGVTVCPKPFSADDTCADARTAYSGPGKKPGDPCRGWLDEGKPPGLPSEGVLDCDMCYGDARLGQGVPGAACRGMHKDGNMYDGKWSCE